MASVAWGVGPTVSDSIVQVVRERTGSNQAAEFAGQCLQRIEADAPEARGPAALTEALLGLWALAQHRDPGELKLCVRPGAEAQGIATVIEIVTDDVPFLLDTMQAQLAGDGYGIGALHHPVLPVRREHGSWRDCVQADNTRDEALIHIGLMDRLDDNDCQLLAEVLKAGLEDVRTVAADTPAITRALIALADDTTLAPSLDPEVRLLLRWLAGGNFILLGHCIYEPVEACDGTVLKAIPGSGLGLLRDALTNGEHQQLPMLPRRRPLAQADSGLVITKADRRSTVHRAVHMDDIGVRWHDAQGRMVLEWRFLGLYEAAAYATDPLCIPLIRRKVERVIGELGQPVGGYSDRLLRETLQSLPRDELFQADEAELRAAAGTALRVSTHGGLHLSLREDPFGHFVFCFVHVPRGQFNTTLRRRLQAVLADTFQALSSEFEAQFTRPELVRLRFTLRTCPEALPAYDIAALQHRLLEVSRPWEERLRLHLLEACGRQQGEHLYRRYGAGFPAAYEEEFPPRTGTRDILRLEGIADANALGVRLYRASDDAPERVRFKVLSHQPLSVSQILPLLERFGLSVHKARPFDLTGAHGARLGVLDFEMSPDTGLRVDVERDRERLETAFARVHAGDAENDAFNRLVLGAGLDWRQVTVLRAFARYMLQLGAPFSPSYMQQTLAAHPGVARSLVALFEVRFDPDLQDDRDAATGKLDSAVEAALAEVSRLDEDRILRRFLGLVQATVRTNYYQRLEDGIPKPYLALKLDPSCIEDMPEPRPRHETFVYSPRFEAVHLRGAAIARGGLRWSDRLEDFRTEILGLVRAQMVKNAVIVPAGAKGGFVLKRPPAGDDPAALQREAQACYRTFIRGLLDITDNRVDDRVVPPPRLVRHDGDDPYLVVAADKGTATFSDLANAVAAEYGFWLGDAFASGGRTGYDHKRLGITARGAWESVRHHFRQLGTDIQETPFTVVGIGDPGGDVFGNGMLLSRHIRLVAAFNHRHIVLDPDPDPERSWSERQRLFQAVRGWDAYDPACLSAGGGIYRRDAKSIAITPEVRQALAITARHMTPDALIEAILCAPVDLLWNGGIGTYVKAAAESHGSVGDRANDRVRVDAESLRCRVVGEGGNLGFTPAARVAFARMGGRVFSDAVDNAGGVNCSDHEVNLKILLDRRVAAGILQADARDALLADMAEEVAELVLAQNRRQAEAITTEVERAAALLAEHAAFLRTLEACGRLDRHREALPEDPVLADRAAGGQGLVAPELTLLLAHAKDLLKAELLLHQDLLREPWARRELTAYFPHTLRTVGGDDLLAHPLAAEILATRVANEVVDRMGPVFVFCFGEELAAAPADAVRAYIIARELAGAAALWDQLRELHRPATGAATVIRGRLKDLVRWLLLHRPCELDVDAVLDLLRDPLDALCRALPETLSGPQRERLEAERAGLAEHGLTEADAARLAALAHAAVLLDAIIIARDNGRAPAEVARYAIAAFREFQLDWLRQALHALPATERWERRARNGLIPALDRALHRLIAAEPSVADGDHPATGRAGRLRDLLTEIRTAATPQFTQLALATEEVRRLAETLPGQR